MKESYKVNITPNLYDPEGEPMIFLRELAGRIANLYQTDVNAAVQPETARDYLFEIYLINQRVGAFGPYHENYVHEAVESEEGLDNPVHVFCNLFDSKLREIASGK